MSEHQYTIFPTKHGFAALAWNDFGVSSLRLPADTEALAEASILRRFPKARRPPPSAVIVRLIADINRYFDGERIDFSAVPLDLGTQDPFFSKVYEKVRQLGWGKTTTYGAVAKQLGAEPQAARDVGQAMASNPVPLIVPCHRVLAAGGKIGGFSAPGGSGSKAKMLAIEGVKIEAGKPSSTDDTTRAPISLGF
jgi:methylated-DNA-[protein]-cysteine S-methyltransferase